MAAVVLEDRKGSGTPGKRTLRPLARVAAPFLAGLSGDYNKNHVVDAGDYTLWRKNLNSQSGYNSWRSNFGATGGAGTSVESTDIPEPSTLALLLVGLQWIAIQRRPRRAPHSA